MQKKTVSKDVPLSEITLRKYEKPYDLDGRELAKKLCLSLGLLQPGDSRDVIVDVLVVLLSARDEKKFLTSEGVVEKVIAYRKKENLALKGVASSNIRRQLKRLKDIFLVECITNQYRINEFDNLKNMRTFGVFGSHDPRHLVYVRPVDSMASGMSRKANVVRLEIDLNHFPETWPIYHNIEMWKDWGNVTRPPWANHDLPYASYTIPGGIPVKAITKIEIGHVEEYEG